MDEASKNEEQPWIEIHDPEISSADLVGEVAERARHRRDEQGAVEIDFPPFGTAHPTPDVATAPDDPTRLHYFLRQLDQLPPPETQPELAASPASRVPMLGRLWQLIRREAHNLVLFYVNRNVAHNAAANRHVANALNEMAALVQAQQAEMERLREELAQWKDEAQNSGQDSGHDSLGNET